MRTDALGNRFFSRADGGKRARGIRKGSIGFFFFFNCLAYAASELERSTLLLSKFFLKCRRDLERDSSTINFGRIVRRIVVNKSWCKLLCKKLSLCLQLRSRIEGTQLSHGLTISDLSFFFIRIRLPSNT